jgi:putative ABC transport system substrate-binding protein
MNRRDFITLLGGAAVWPLAARGQQGDRVRRIGVLTGADENDHIVFGPGKTGCGAVCPSLTRAQPRAVPVIGYLGSVSPDDVERTTTAAFLQGLQEAGYCVGQNVMIGYRWVSGRSDRVLGVFRCRG